ncbi:hypothetical protein ACN38_g4419 [Penicillium nordicum]|uniref:Uncharacterized protein n=1 Tax=Penicillium nordicum TaxID=229535 RepID=A0A0M9WH37_9EURO|nr:hypothetical protein ACN38_g4419 [Penicillium nordicum]
MGETQGCPWRATNYRCLVPVALAAYGSPQRGRTRELKGKREKKKKKKLRTNLAMATSRLMHVGMRCSPRVG